MKPVVLGHHGEESRRVIDEACDAWDIMTRSVVEDESCGALANMVVRGSSWILVGLPGEQESPDKPAGSHMHPCVYICELEEPGIEAVH